MNIASLFGFGNGGGIQHGGSGNTAGRVTQVPTNNPQQQLTTGNQPAPGAADPGAKNDPAPDPLNSHLDTLKSVWDTPTDATGKPLAPQADPLAAPLFTFKPEDVVKGASNLDFTSSLNPEQVTKALSGDIEAFKEVINGAVRSAFIASTVNTGSMLNDGFSRHGRAIDAALPTRIKNYELANSQSEDPVLQHQAVSPMLKSLKAMLAATNPGMPAHEIQERAEAFISGVGKAYSIKEQGTQQKQKVAGETDWLDWSAGSQGS